MPAQRRNGSLQVDRVPQDDGRRHQVQTARPVALLLEAAVTDFAQSVEENRPCQCVARLALVQASVNASAQLHALQPALLRGRCQGFPLPWTLTHPRKTSSEPRPNAAPFFAVTIRKYGPHFHLDSGERHPYRSLTLIFSGGINVQT